MRTAPKLWNVSFIAGITTIVQRRRRRRRRNNCSLSISEVAQIRGTYHLDLFQSSNVVNYMKLDIEIRLPHLADRKRG